MVARGCPTNFDNQTLIKAELDIDNAIANFYQGGFSKALITKNSYEITLTNTTATIINKTFQDGYFSKTVVQLLGEEDKVFFVKSSVNNVLTFQDSQDLDGTYVALIYQLAKAPFYKDKFYKNNTIYKTIDNKIKEAVAIQYQYLSENSSTERYPISGYSVDGEDYSERYNTDKMTTSIDRLDPRAYDLIAHLTVQSL